MEQGIVETDKISHLLTRNVSEIITKVELENRLKAGRPLKVYLGVDPSSPEIHLGHAVVLRKLREFQDLGHKVMFLIGNFTAQIGDPTGKSKERVPLSDLQVAENAKTYQEQAAKIIRFDGPDAAEIRFNSAWLDKLNLKDVIKLAGYFTVQQMIERDMFQDRLKAGQSIGLHEFLYPLLVGYDSVMLDVDVEIGGNDQLFNIKAGRTLMEKMKGKKKEVLTCDLLTGSDGSKMSKSAGNAIAITAAPEEMFGALMAVRDSLIAEYARLASDMSASELELLHKRLTSGENPRDIKMDVAERIVALYSSPDLAEDAREKFEFMFSKGADYHGVPPVDAFFPAPVATMALTELVALMAVRSRSAARRLVQDGAVDIDGKTVNDPAMQLDLNSAHVIKIGKHHFMRVQYLDSAKQGQ